MNRRAFLAVTTATVPFLAGCTGSGESGAGQTTTQTPTATTATTAETTPSESTSKSTPATSPDATIVMQNTTFQTLRAQVPTGGTVEWVNEDGYGHTVTSAQFHDVATSWEFDASVPGDGRVTHTFDENGIYEYYCTIHGESSMCGVVLVGGTTLDPSLPCESDSDGGGSSDGDGEGGAYRLGSDSSTSVSNHRPHS